MAALQQQVQQATQAALAAGANPQRLAEARRLMKDNPQAYINLCQKFVENVAGTSGQYPSAIAASNAIEGRTDWANMRPGDTIYFTANAGNQGYGHTGIYAGNGMFINPGPNGVVEQPLTDWMNQTGQRLIEYIPADEGQRAPGLAGYAGGYANEDDFEGNIEDFADVAGSAAPTLQNVGGQGVTTRSRFFPGMTVTRSPQVPYPAPAGTRWLGPKPDGSYILWRDDMTKQGVFIRGGVVDTYKPGTRNTEADRLDALLKGYQVQKAAYDVANLGQPSPESQASNALGWASYYRGKAQDEWQQATDQRDFDAAEKWRNIANQWKEREVALQEEQYLTGLEKNPADWAAYSYASRGQQGNFPRASAPPEGIQSLAGAGRNVPEWLRGMYNNLTPNAAGTALDAQGNTDLGSAFLTHLSGIGSSLESPDVGTQYNDWMAKRQENLPKPASVKDTPWFNAAFKGSTLTPYRAPALGLPNLGALASMTPTEKEQMGGAYAAEGIPFQDILDTLKRRIPTGRAPMGRWGG